MIWLGKVIFFVLGLKNPFLRKKKKKMEKKKRSKASAKLIPVSLMQTKSNRVPIYKCKQTTRQGPGWPLFSNFETP